MATPWMKWYPRDWRADPALRSCSLAARGLWIELIGYMHEAHPYGHLLIGGGSPTHAEIGRFTGVHHNAVTALVTELVSRGVASVSPEGVIFSRRMVRDNEKALKNRENGAKGGNPELVKTDNPEVKAQIPEARSQIPEKKKEERAVAPGFDLGEQPPSADLDKQFFSRAVEIVDARPDEARRIAGTLKKACGGDITQARRKLEQAVGRDSPKQFLWWTINDLKKKSAEPQDATVLMTNADDSRVLM